MFKKIFLFTLAVGLLALTGLHITQSQPGIIENIHATLAYPFVVTSHWVTESLASSRTKKLSYAEMQQRCEKMENRYQELFTQYVDARMSVRFDTATQELTDFRQRYNFNKAILGRVLTRTLTDAEQTIIINQGSSHGVKPDMVAIYKLQIIGRVLESYPHMSKIMLMTDKRSKISGFTNTTNAGGIVVGSNIHNRCFMVYVSHLNEIVDEDFVFSSGQGLVFPEGFCLGKVVHHEHKERELYHAIEMEPLVDLQGLSYCLLSSPENINLF